MSHSDLASCIIFPNVIGKVQPNAYAVGKSGTSILEDPDGGTACDRWDKNASFDGHGLPFDWKQFSRFLESRMTQK